MPAKNTLTAADAEPVEASFRVRLAALGDEATHGKLELTGREAPADRSKPGYRVSPVT
jgi:hypothetical protein